jgi:hypothetical protein
MRLEYNMALIASNLKDSIKNDLQGKGTASDALSALATTVATYIKDNAVVNFGWVAALANPPFTPDPIVVASGGIIALSFTLTPSMATTQTDAMTAIKTQFIAGLSLGTYNITDAGFTTSPGLLSTSPTINTLSFSISGTDQDTALLQFATGIINWVKAQVPITPCSGTHGTFVGVGTVVSIV